MPGQFAYENQLKKINAHLLPLNKPDQVIDREMFCSPIEEVHQRGSKIPGGRPDYDRRILLNFEIDKK